MKILMLADTMNIGGAETHIYELSRSLFSMGHEVGIFSGGGATADMLCEDARLFYTDSLQKLPFSFSRAARDLARALREFKPDLVHAHTRRGLFLAKAVLKVMPFPLVFTAHAKFSSAPLKRFFTKTPQYTIAVSEDIKGHFIKRFSAKDVTVIENGIDTARFAPVDGAGKKMRILHVSRLDKDCSKAAELLCHIALRLSRIFEDCEITLVGGGSDLGRIKSLADSANRQAGRAVIICVGARSNVLPYLEQADVFVGVSRAALEAMSCGIPTVICGSEGYFGVCERDNFALCAKENFCARGYAEDDGEKLIEQITLIAQDENRRRFFVRDLIEADFSSAVMVEKTLEVYKKAVLQLKQKKKYDAVVCGYYGFGNLGDEVVLNNILADLGKLRVGVIGAHGDGRIWRFNIPAVVSAIRSSGLLIMGGGSLLQNDTSNRSLKYYLSLLKIAFFFGRRTMLYANGFGPVLGEKAVSDCKKALEAIDAASFRDRDSLSAVKDLLPQKAKIYLSRDPALTLLSPREFKPRISVFIRGGDCKEELASALSEALSGFCGKNGREVVFASMNKREDEKAAKKLAERMPYKSSFELFDTPEKLIAFIASSEVVISSRLHALILAASAGIPFVALCRDPKLKAFAKECAIPDVLSPRLDSQNLACDLRKALSYATRYGSELSERISYSVQKLLCRTPKDKETALDFFKL